MVLLTITPSLLMTCIGQTYAAVSFSCFHFSRLSSHCPSRPFQHVNMLTVPSMVADSRDSVRKHDSTCVALFRMMFHFLRSMKAIERVGGKLPAEHGHGTEYAAPADMQQRWQLSDPTNTMLLECISELSLSLSSAAPSLQVLGWEDA